MPKLSTIDRLSRLDYVSELIGQELKRSDILNRIYKKYGISERQGDRLITESRQYIISKHKENRDETRTIAINRYKQRIKYIQSLTDDEMTQKDREGFIRDYLKRIDALEGNDLPERKEIATVSMKQVNINIQRVKSPMKYSSIHQDRERDNSKRELIKHRESKVINEN